VSAGGLVQLYLSAARRLWQQLPMVIRARDSQAVREAAAALLHVLDESVWGAGDDWAPLVNAKHPRVPGRSASRRIAKGRQRR
jgi:hypothetical protein